MLVSKHKVLKILLKLLVELLEFYHANNGHMWLFQPLPEKMWGSTKITKTWVKNLTG